MLLYCSLYSVCLRNDLSSATAKLNDTNTTKAREGSVNRPDSGRHDVAILPNRKMRPGVMKANRPQSSQISYSGLTWLDNSTDSGDFQGETDAEVNQNTDATTLRAIVYKNWYRRHLHSAQMNRISSLKQEVLDTKAQREVSTFVFYSIGLCSRQVAETVFPSSSDDKDGIVDVPFVP